MSDPFKKCPFGLLHLPVTATKEEVNRQWRQLLRLAHPDKSGELIGVATEQAQILNHARDRALLLCKQVTPMEQQKRDEARRRQMDGAQAEKKRAEENRVRLDEERRRAERKRAEESRIRLEEERRRAEISRPVYETIYSFMARHSNEDRDGLKNFEKLGEFPAAFFARTGQKASPFCMYGAMYGMAETINQNTDQAQAAKVNLERLQFELREREIKAEHATGRLDELIKERELERAESIDRGVKEASNDREELEDLRRKESASVGVINNLRRGEEEFTKRLVEMRATRSAAIRDSAVSRSNLDISIKRGAELEEQLDEAYAQVAELTAKLDAAIGGDKKRKGVGLEVNDGSKSRKVLDPEMEKVVETFLDQHLKQRDKNFIASLDIWAELEKEVPNWDEEAFLICLKKFVIYKFGKAVRGATRTKINTKEKHHGFLNLCFE